jgi:ubiquinone/menaquinone biosynthesis C-methylase UbiE
MSAEDGTPRLMPGDARRTVSFEFAAQRAVSDEQTLLGFLRYPPNAGPARGLPYHLDQAHVDVISALPKGATILEVGCGGGQMRSWVEGIGHRYVGTDISKTRVFDWLQRYGGPDLLCDAHFLPFAAGTFDVLYSAAVTEHLACPELAMREAARVLKPGGWYLSNVSFLEPWHDSSFFHMSPLGAIELLQRAEFEVMSVWPGKGYSGYQALMSMGNRQTGWVSPAGGLMYSYYRLGNRTRDAVKRLLRRSTVPAILDDAKVAGAVDWIARRPATAR